MKSNHSYPPTILDCTLRDGGYYNSWDFPPQLVDNYISAMKAAQIDVVELGFRLIEKTGYKGPFAYTSDDYLDKLTIPDELDIAVMINGSDLYTDLGLINTLKLLFPRHASDSRLNTVRCACHFHQIPSALLAASWLHEHGYKVCINLMNIADIKSSQIKTLLSKINNIPIDVLYIADSTGSLRPEKTIEIISILRTEWSGNIGIHTHDNLGLALENTLIAYAYGATWLDSTVTGMGRGPGNARTEELAIEAEMLRGRRTNMVPLISLINKVFKPMKNKYGWGTNAYYYLAGKYGIHPSYIQEMLVNSRYNDEDIFAVINHLRNEGGKKFSVDSIESALQFYSGEPIGTFDPKSQILERDILILGSGSSLILHSDAIESYILKSKPLVLALNTSSIISSSLIDLRIACHPVRLLADADTYSRLSQPLVTPVSMLPAYLRSELSNKCLLDYGLGVKSSTFEFYDTYCILPRPLVLAYALAFASSGKANQIFMAGFDGYDAGDPRNNEIEQMLSLFYQSNPSLSVMSITNTSYQNLASTSLYAL